MPERLPTLYPMPRDIGQYRVIASAATDEPPQSVYFGRLLRELKRENDTDPYVSPEDLLKLEAGETKKAKGLEMVNRIDANIRRLGIVEINGNKVIPSEVTKAWDLSAESFPTFIRDTIFGWGSR